MNNNIDLLLVHPNGSKKIYQTLSTRLSAIEPPIWISLLANGLRKKGHRAGVLDTEAENISATTAAKKIVNINPRLVALVAYGQNPQASTPNMVGLMDISAALSGSNIPIIYVGAHPSALPEKTILDDKAAFVAKGEGLFTLDKLLQVNMFDETQLSTVPGLYYYSKSKDIVSTKPAELIKNLDEELPGLAWDLLPSTRYKANNWLSWTNNNKRQPFASIYTSLGCPYSCSFCMINAPFGTPRIRYWSPEFVITELDKIAEMGITNLKIADEMFVLNPNHFARICELIVERGHKFNIWCYARIDTIKDEYLSLLKRAGVNWIALGIESANRNIRLESAKGQYKDVDIVDIVNKIRYYDISIIGNYIIGLPGENIDTMKETLALAQELNTEYASFCSAMAYPGSRLHREISVSAPELLPENNGVSWVGYSQYSAETFNLPTEFLSAGEILKFRDFAFNTYHSDERYINMMTKKFGPRAADELKDMLSYSLKRTYANR